KIPPTLIGARIKCRKCGVSFMVSPPAAKAHAAVATAHSPEGPQGIEVEGLEASTWALSNDTGVALKVEATADPYPSADPNSAFVAAGASPAETREYKLLTSRDKCFDGKFDLARLEEVLNQHSRQGWVAKSMMVPHFKAFTGAMEEVI